MPNWCSNELSIQGDSEEIKRFMLASTGFPARYAPSPWEIKGGYRHPTEPYFCFNALVPTPEEVLAIGYDGHQKFAELVKEKGQDAIIGMMDGYHWNIMNWGTKWDVYNEGLTLENCGWEEGITELALSFDTAWSPPIAWLRQVAAMFPELRFALCYAEPGCCFAGEVICQGESYSEHEYDDERCQQLFDAWFGEDEDDLEF